MLVSLSMARVTMAMLFLHVLSYSKNHWCACACCYSRSLLARLSVLQLANQWLEDFFRPLP